MFSVCIWRQVAKKFWPNSSRNIFLTSFVCFPLSVRAEQVGRVNLKALQKQNKNTKRKKKKAQLCFTAEDRILCPWGDIGICQSVSQRGKELFKQVDDGNWSRIWLGNCANSWSISERDDCYIDSTLWKGIRREGERDIDAVGRQGI